MSEWIDRLPLVGSLSIRPFAGLGIPTVGHSGGYAMATANVTGYTNARGEITDWHGAVILSGRPATIKRYRLRDGETEAVVIRFGRDGRSVAGYSLGEGMLFRGELCYANEDAEGRARAVAEYWIDRDAEDEQQFDYEQSLAGAE